MFTLSQCLLLFKMKHNGVYFEVQVITLDRYKTNRIGVHGLPVINSNAFPGAVRSSPVLLSMIVARLQGSNW